jgi:MFS family permease
MVYKKICTIRKSENLVKLEAVGQNAKNRLIAWPLILMIIISIFSNITEGSMADWTAVYMKDVVKTSDYAIGFGLSAYSFLMAIGRFSGDGLAPRFGANRLLMVGGMLVALGLLLTIILPYSFTAIIGFAIIGFGVSFSSPILYGSAARMPGYSDGKGLAILNSFGMIGFLGGPVVIGFFAHEFSLKIAFTLLLVMALIWSLVSKYIKLY